MPHPDYGLLLKSLVHRAALPDEDIALLESLEGETIRVRRDGEIVPVGVPVQHCCLVISGFAARVIRFNGRRQISAVNIPGDFVDVHSLVLQVLEHSVIALTDCEIVRIPHGALRRATDRSPHLGRVLWMLTAIEAATHRVWISSLGRRTSVEHLAHFFCEMHHRLDLVGLVEEDGFGFPVEQVDLADALGLSAVHVSRSVKALREQGLVSWQDRMVQIHDFAALAKLAAFDPTYLSLDRLTR